MNLCKRLRNTVPVMSLFVFIHLCLTAAVLAGNLSGTYTMTSEGIILTLVLQEDGRGNLGGRLTSTSGANFKVEGVIQDGVGVGKCVSSQGGVYFEAHPQGDQLLFALIEPGPDSQPDFNRVQQLLFTRKTGEPTGSPGGIASGGQERLLQGRLCSYSGSSSSSSSLSRTGWAYFDGRGNFSYGSEASFSSEAGIYHRGGGNADGGGTYRVMGNQIRLSFSNGSTGLAKVVIQEDNGRITEMMYEGALYGVELCQ